VPSVIAMNTSQYPRTTGIPNRLHDEIPTLAEMLYSAGYDTHAIIGNPILKTELGFDKGFDKYEQYLEYKELRAVQISTNYLFMEKMRNFLQTHVFKSDINHTDLARYNAKWCTINSSKFIDSRKNQKRPFFLYIHYFDPHAPLWAPAKYITNKDLIDGYEPKKSYEKMSTSHIREMYSSECRHSDDNISIIWNDLKNNELLDNTLIFITSDHGEELMERGEYDHGHTMYPELTYIPFIVVYPDGIPHADSDYPVSLLDIMPTALDIAGIESLPDMEGLSLIGNNTNISKEINPRSIFVDGTRSKRDDDLAIYEDGYYYILNDKVDGPVMLDLNAYKNGELLTPNILSLDKGKTNELDNELTGFQLYLNKLKSERGVGEAIHLDKSDVDMLKTLGYM